MQKKVRILLLAGSLALGSTVVSKAAPVTMTADDVSGTSSFNAAGHWSNASAPSAGNTYDNNAFLLRTPGDGNSYVFGGDSLTITSDQPFGSQLNDALIYKGSASSTITINNFTVNGGVFRHGNSESQTFTLAGNGLTVGPLGMAVHIQGPTIISDPLLGSGLIRIVDNGSNDSRRTLEIANIANTFNGNIDLPAANRSRLRLDAGANLNFVPTTSGVSNTITGVGVADFNGVFDIDLTNASTTLGDTWQLVAGSTLVESYGATFSVAGFTEDSSNVWRKSISPGSFYQFDEATGALSVTVPEPSSLMLLAGLGGFVFRRRRA